MEKQKNIPKLRFPEFEGKWEFKRLGDVAEIYDGTHQTPKYVKSGIPFYSVEQVTSNDFNNTKFISEDVYMIESKRIVIEKGDILMTRIGDIGTPRLIDWDVKASFYVSLALIKQSNKYNSEFFSQYIKTRNFRKELWNRTIHVAFPIKINLGEIGNCKASFPSLPEQQKIASFFTVIDQKISQLKRKKTLLEQYKKGVMQKIFSQEIRFKDDNGQEFPKWEKKRLSEIFIEINETVGTRDIPTYSITAGVGFVSQNEKFGRNISGQQNKHYTVINEGQFSYNKGNSKTYTYGCIYVNDTGKRIAVPNVFISFEFIDQKMSSQFYSKLFESHYLDKGLRKIISSSARMDGLLNVNKNSFFQLSVPCPNYIEQKKIGHFLYSIDSKIFHIKNQIEKAEVWKKGLMQQMFV
ncbi:MAG: restriction endonuclease subunit S [Caldisericales bacterium]|nr:restriction endonuclease subunit S [Caldisericales bacterium]